MGMKCQQQQPLGTGAKETTAPYEQGRFPSTVRKTSAHTCAIWIYGALPSHARALLHLPDGYLGPTEELLVDTHPRAETVTA